MLLFDLLFCSFAGLVFTLLAWQISPAFILIAAISFAFPVRAWLNADKIVASLVGFREPTLVQRRYLDYLKVSQKVLTHPSFFVAAGAVASSRRRIILLSSGAIKQLGDENLSLLIRKLSAREREPIFRWTFHFATVGAPFFGIPDEMDPHKYRTRIMSLTIGLFVLMFTIFTLGLIVYWLLASVGLSLLVLFYATIRWSSHTAKKWNSPIELNELTLQPMNEPIGPHRKLNFIRHGFVYLNDIPEFDETEASVLRNDPVAIEEPVCVSSENVTDRALDSAVSDWSFHGPPVDSVTKTKIPVQKASAGARESAGSAPRQDDRKAARRWTHWASSKLVLLLDIAVYLGLGVAIAILWWPLARIVSIAFLLSPIAYLGYAWFHADRIVSRKAGFSAPTLVQSRYLEYLGIEPLISTHPSRLPAAGVVASKRNKIILLTAGALEELPDDDLRDLVKTLAARNQRAVFEWTFHLATAGVRFFAASEEATLSWGKAVFYAAAIMAVSMITTALIFTTLLAPYDANQVLPVEPSFMPLVLFTGFFALKFGGRYLNKGLTFLSSTEWNQPIKLSAATLEPVARIGGYHSNLRLLRKGLVFKSAPQRDRGE